MPVREAASISCTSTLRRFGDGDAGLADAAGMDGGLRALAVRPDAVERAGDDARGGGLAHAAHAGQHEGMGDAAGGEGVGQRAHQRFLPDQAGEIGRAVFARQHAIGLGLCRRGGQAKRGVLIIHSVRLPQFSQAAPTNNFPSFRFCAALTRHSVEMKAQWRWESGSDPRADSLRLLPSGPDRIGERLVHHQTPVADIKPPGSNCKSHPFRSRREPSAPERSPMSGEGVVARTCRWRSSDLSNRLTGPEMASQRYGP